MKKRSLALSIVGTILAAILLVVIVCAIVANSQNDKSLPTAELSRWMNMIKDNTPLKTVAIAGAHDAGTKGLPYLAETQDRTTMQLLECGTRYLDLRVTKSGNGLKIFHGPFSGVTLDSVLTDIKAFLAENSSETVILDFQHFGGNAEADVLAKVLEMLQEILLQNTSGKTDVEFIDTLTLGQARGKCLVVWGDNFDETITAEAAKVVFRRNNDDGTRDGCVIHSYYESGLNKKFSANYIKSALPHYIEKYQQQGSGLFVLQGQLTDGLFVFGPHFREATHTKKMNKYLNGLADSENLAIINIVIRDYVSPAKNCATLQLNLQKGNVKEEFSAIFEEMIASNS